MVKTFRNLTLAGLLLPFAIPAFAGDTSIKELLSGPRTPEKRSKLKLCVEADPAAAEEILQAALNDENTVEYRCSALAALGACQGKAATAGLLLALNDKNTAVQSCAIRAAGDSKSGAAIKPLLANIEKYLASARDNGPYEANLKARLKAIDSIWELGEIGSAEVMNKFETFYLASDNTLRINLVISMGKLEANPYSAPYLRKLAASPQEAEVVRAAAFEMLDGLGQEASVGGLVRSKELGVETGDLLYTGGIIGDIGSWFNPDLPIGHTSIFLGTEVIDGRIYVQITDCVPDWFVPPGARNINLWKYFTHQFKFPFYGSRTSKVPPTREQREKIVKLGREMGAKGYTYNNSHFAPKGPKEFDCVGYTEYIYEQAGVNPTPDDFETGLGWPLTPWEQFEATVSHVLPRVPYRAAANTAPGSSAQRTSSEILKKGLFGVSGELPEINAEINPEKAD